MKIGFIGLGVMGNSIVNNLIDANHELFIYTRTSSKALNLIKKGATYCSSPAQVTKMSDIIMTMVGMPEDVEDVYLSKNGIISEITSEKICVDLTTSTPNLAIKLSKIFKEKNVDILDAPVSGGDLGAKNATLTIMVGGTKEAYDKMLPIFKIIGSQIVHQGKSGNGQHTKMCNQICLAGNMLGAIELIVYARTVGLNINSVLESVEKGSAGSTAMSLYAKRILNDDYEAGFYIKHYVKDLKIAIDVCEKHNILLPGLEIAHTLYKKLQNDGFENLGTQALIKAYKR